MNLLKAITALCFITLLLTSIISVRNSSAESVAACHCFKNRTFNPADKFASDGYILATSFNSLLAKAFDISKQQVVMLKMRGGVDQNDLLLGLKTAKITGVDLKLLLNRRKRNDSWQTILADPSVKENLNDNPLLESIQKGLPVSEAGQRVADALLADFYKVPAEKIRKFRLDGLNEKEMALVFILAHAKNQKPEAFAEQHRIQGKSWSEIADLLGIAPAEAGKLILNFPAQRIN